MLADMNTLGRYLNVQVPAVLDPEFGVEPYRYSYNKVKANPDAGQWWLYLLIH